MMDLMIHITKNRYLLLIKQQLIYKILDISLKKIKLLFPL